MVPVLKYDTLKTQLHCSKAERCNTTRLQIIARNRIISVPLRSVYYSNSLSLDCSIRLFKTKSKQYKSSREDDVQSELWLKEHLTLSTSTLHMDQICNLVLPQ